MATLVPLLIIAVIFVFMVVAPGRRRAREAQTMRSSLAPGVDVVTTAGVYGRVDSIDTEQGTVDLEVSDGVIVRFASQAIARVISSDADADSDTESTTGSDPDSDSGSGTGSADDGDILDDSTGGHDAANLTPQSDIGSTDSDDVDKTTDEKKADNGSNRGPDGASS